MNNIRYYILLFSKRDIHRGRIIAGIIILCFGMFVAADADAQTWRIFTTSDGLADNHVNELLEDSHGNLWVVTDEGLSQFNGLFITHLKFINHLLEARDGAIWAGGAGLHRYDGTWRNVTPPESGFIQVLRESKDKSIWAGTDEGLYRYDGQTWQQHLSSMEITDLLESKDGTIWAGTSSGLYHYNGETWTPYLSGKSITVLLESKNGTIWAGTTMDGLNRYNGTTWVKQPIGMLAAPGNRIFKMLESSSDGALWVWSLWDGLQRYDGRAWTQQLSESEIDTQRVLFQSKDGTIWAGGPLIGLLYSYKGTVREKQLDGVEVTALIESLEGRIWVGTQQGLFMSGRIALDGKLSGDRIAALRESLDGTIWAGGGDLSGLRSYDGKTWVSHLNQMSVFSLLQSKDGTIWAGTSSGLYSYYGTKWSVEGQLRNIEYIFSLLQSSDGTIWAGTSSGLYRYDRVKWRLEEQLGKMQILSLLESKDNVIWAGTFGGLYRYDGVTWQKNNLSANIKALLQSSDGTIWAGGFGLYRYDGITWMPEERTNRMSIKALFESSDGRIWVGTHQSGVQIYDGTIWGEFTTLDGLPGSDVETIIEDRNKKIWFGTSNGIGFYNPSYSAPGIQIINPQGASVSRGSPSIFIEWIARDLGTDTHRLTYQYTIDNLKAWSIPVSITFINTPILNDGVHIFYVRAIDHELNISMPASLTINVDTIRPDVVITDPTENAFVSNREKPIEIRGVVRDKDLSKFRVEYSVALEGNFKSIKEGNHEVDLGLLTEWNPLSLAETEYTIRVHAEDELGHDKEDTITVTLDNTPPIAKLIAPLEGSRLTTKTLIRCEFCDKKQLARYELHFTKEPSPDTKLWEQIRAEPLTGTESSIDYTWNIPDNVRGNIWLRLTAFDMAGNPDEKIISVEVPLDITKDKGGDVRSSDGMAFIYVPPHSLTKDTVITINSIPETDIAVASATPNTVLLSRAYELSPENIKLVKHKPVTLSISYDGIIPDSTKRLTIAHYNGNLWVPFGGTVNTEEKTVTTTITEFGQLKLGSPMPGWKWEKTVTTTITEFGRYALMELESDIFDLPEMDSLFTCQPRVLIPESGKAITISFALKEKALVTLKVYSIDGRLQKTFSEDMEMYAGHNAVLWDGTDQKGEMVVSSGLYIIAFRAGKQDVKTKTIVIQNRSEYRKRRNYKF